MPDYANKESTDRTTSGTWTSDRRGFVYLYSYGYAAGATYSADIFTINGQVVGHTDQEARNPNNVSTQGVTGIFPVNIGDVIVVNGANSHKCFFIPGRWV